tara:strand:+ start:3188 stop:4603 length:1416 start_codon:yes stop_codon:yes gene_type:complete
MARNRIAKDYRLDGPNNALAINTGLANAIWWRPPLERDKLLELTKRNNSRMLLSTSVWLILTISSGYLLYTTWFSAWSVLLFFCYGGLYGGASDSRWHECGHGTAFRSPVLNRLVYYLASFMLWREPTVWRWSHFRHHSDTIIVGRDYEIAFPRPTNVWLLPITFSHIINGPRLIYRMMKHACGRIDSEVAEYVPAEEFRRVIWEARIFLSLNLCSLTATLILWSPFPIVLLGAPTLYGAWLFVFFGLTQHAGLQEDVLDHRKNTRTVLMNPVFRFLYLNMNYHLEHHLFPEVPYHSLPNLHRELTNYLPDPSPSCRHAYSEIIGILKEQSKNPQVEIKNADRLIPEVKSSLSSGNNIVIPKRSSFTEANELCTVDDLPVGSMKRVDHQSGVYLLCRPSEEEIILSDGYCTHGNALLSDGVLNESIIECPKHNGRFDLQTGKAIRKPAKDTLRLFDTYINENTIFTNFTNK